MNRSEKELIINGLKEDFQKSQASFLIGVQGLTVEALHGLRKNLIPQGGQLRVAKNTLLKRATQDVQGLTELDPYFKDQIAIVFASKEAPAVAKILADASKSNELVKLIAGTLDNRVISKDQVQYLAALPAREVLLAQVCGTLQAPIAGLASVLNQLILRLLWVLKKIEEQKNV
jgi:large subunit ribosomal protein L10